jgi:2'-5' RNA ligase
MAAEFERVAIYWAPAAGSALEAFGRTWLGADAATGQHVAVRECYGLQPDFVEQAAASPRRYALHATLKAPFRLREGVTLEMLRTELAAFAGKRRRFRTGPLRLHRFSRYLVLTAGAPIADLDWLAAECVTHFDHFRAPLSQKERDRRGALDAAGQALLESFGYPDIFNRFRFHITLAGPLDGAGLAAVEEALAPAVAPFCTEPFQVEDICLFGDPGPDGIFSLIERFPLRR